MEWVVVATAPDQITGEMWCQILGDSGIPARLSPRDTISFLGISAGPCRLQVLKGWESDARAIIGEALESPPEK